MKTLIVCLSLVAFGIASVQAGPSAKDKTACADKAQAGCCEGASKTACSKASAKTAGKKTPATARGGQLAQR